MVGGAAALIVFVVIEARSPWAMVPLSLFTSRVFGGVNVLTLLVYAGLSGSLFFLPFNLIQVQGYSATAAGAALLPFVLIMFALSRWSGTLVDRYGSRTPLIVGPVLAAAGILLYAVPGIGGAYWATFFPAVALHGVGMAITVAPLTTVVMGSVEERHAGVASGINNAVSRTAGLLAIAVMGVVMLAGFNGSLDGRLTNLSLPSEARAAIDAQRTELAATDIPPGLGPELTAELRRALNESFVGSFRTVMFICGGLALAGALVAVMTMGRRTALRVAALPPAPGT